MADWTPRDAYERRWVRELVAAMWRQDRLRGLELATLAAAEQESPPTEATMKRLLTFARYGARIDKDMTMALRALRVLRDRPDARIAETQKRTSELRGDIARAHEMPLLPARPNEPCLVGLWHGGGAPPLCRGVERGVGDRNEPRAASPWLSVIPPRSQVSPNG